MLTCFYALGGINYKNGIITTCPRQANQLVFANETILPSEIYNHKNFKELRKTLYNDKWPSGCDTCMDMEKVGAQSMRQDFLVDDKNTFRKHDLIAGEREISNKKLLECFDSKTFEVSNEGLRHVEIRFSNTCNFACLHCSKVYSTGWEKKLKNYEADEDVKRYNLRQLLGTEHRHGPNDKNQMSLSVKESLRIIEDLNENFPDVRYLAFAGGELLYQKQFFPVLKKLTEHPNSKNIEISFHTNFNADFNIVELSDLLEPFGKSSIIISVDSGKNIYPYFRHGGKWETLESNIKKFKEYNNFTSIDTSITTSIFQIMDIYDVFESLISLGCTFDASIVQTPQYINPSILMHDFKEEVLKDFEKTEQLLRKYEKDVYRPVNQKRSGKFWFDYIVDYVLKTKLPYHQYNRFLIYRKKSDEIWGQNFNDYFKNYQIVDNELVRV
tara:strand:+ start:4464 stop:5786 length:1323 start_codon:yes stop_codon:yes gene_type:complete